MGKEVIQDIFKDVTNIVGKISKDWTDFLEDKKEWKESSRSNRRLDTLWKANDIRQKNRRGNTMLVLITTIVVSYLIIIYLLAFGKAELKNYEFAWYSSSMILQIIWIWYIIVKHFFKQ